MEGCNISWKYLILLKSIVTEIHYVIKTARNVLFQANITLSISFQNIYDSVNSKLAHYLQSEDLYKTGKEKNVTKGF